MTVTHNNSIHRLFLGALFGCVLLAATSASAQTAPPRPTQTVEAEPIRCWWRVSSGAVRTGETFTLVLTCAVLENDQVQIVPDESRLGSAVAQLAPFDIAGGSHPADLRTANRRFFQYEYQIRMINPDFVGHDVPIPDLTIHFRVNSRMTGGAALQGRDFIYQLPPLSVKILSMVPGDAADIRDSANQSFANIESLRFRASTLRIVAITLLLVGGLAAILTIVRLFRRSTKKATKEAQGISDGAVLGAVSRELAAIQRDAEGGWSTPLVARALAAARIVGGYAVGRPAAQQLVSGSPNTEEGKIAVLARRGKSTTVWSSVTSEELGRAAAGGNGLSAHVPDLQAAIAAFTVAGYSANAALDRSSLDASLGRVVDAANGVKQHHSWPRPLIRRILNRGASEARHP